MRPQTAYRTALVLIPLSIGIGVAGAIIGNWLVVAAMAITLIVQSINLRASRRRLRGRD